MRTAAPASWPRAAAVAAALTAGALTVLGFAPFGLWPAALAGPGLLYWLWREAPPWRAFLLGWAYGLGLLGAGVSWLHISIGQFGGVTPALAMLLTLLFVLAMALYYGLAAWAAARLSRRHAWLLFPACWVLAEWLRGWVLSGFPWLDLGNALLATPLAGYGPVFGVYGMGLAALLTVTLAGRWRRPWAWLLLAALWAGGWGLQRLEWTAPRGATIPVALVQGNVDQALKWQPAEFVPTLRRYRTLTAGAAGARLVVWPETAVPAYADQVEAALLEPLDRQMRSEGRDLLLGIAEREADGRYYNSLVTLGVSGRASYRKRHLVPFGEFMPLEPLLRPLIDLFQIPMSQFSPGPPGPPLLRLAGVQAGLSICYEDAFGAEVAEALPAAAFLVNASNDAWFNDSLAPHQHLEIARMRALETGRDLLRATNTGISAIVDHRGRLRGHLGMHRRGVLSGVVQPRRGATPYVRWGNAPVVWLVLAFLGLGRLPGLRGR